MAARAPSVDGRLVSILAPASLEADQYRVLGDMVEEAPGVSIVGVSSAGIADGKTTTAINLAAVLAETQGTRVLLVEADLRHPSIAGRLGLPAHEGPGLVDALTDPAVALDDVVRVSAACRFSMLLAGRPAAKPFELLKSARFEHLLETARGRFDRIVVDAPPMVLVPDGRVLAKRVDTFFVVVAAHRTSRRALAEALNALDRSKVLGLVFNGDDAPLRGYGYYSVVRAHGGVKPPGRRDGGATTR